MIYMEKETFITKIKKEVSSPQKDITQEKEFSLILDVFSTPQEERNKKVIKLIERGIEMIEEKNSLAPNYFLAISELPALDTNLRSFCVDAMLVAEHDFNGEFKSVDELCKKFSEIKTQ